MKSKKLRILNYTLAAIGILITAAVYSRLPEQIPTNWGFNGIVTYSPKSRIWLCCGLLPLMAFLFDYLPQIDPRRRNYVKFNAYYDTFCVFLQVFLLIMLGITLSESFFPGHISVGKIVTLAIGVLFMFIGNIMPKIKSNFYLGIKTPWTLSDEEIWLRTHRFAGKTMFAAGAAAVILGWSITDRWSGYVIVAMLLASAFVPCLMSYIWWRQKYGTPG